MEPRKLRLPLADVIQSMPADLNTAPDGNGGIVFTSNHYVHPDVQIPAFRNPEALAAWYAGYFAAQSVSAHERPTETLVRHLEAEQRNQNLDAEKES